MKQIIYSLALLALITSCKRDVLTTTPLASLKIINTISDGTPAKLRGVPSTTINNNSNRDFAILPGSQDLYVYPEVDSLKPYYHGNNKVVLDAQQCYSLFLGGTVDAVSSLLIHENWVMKHDSIIRVRFLNFSPGAAAVNVTLSTVSGEHEFSNIEFAELTDFREYTKKGTTPSYLFEVRDAATNDLIISSNLSATNVAAFNYVTLVFRGIVGGTPGPGITRIIHN